MKQEMKDLFIHYLNDFEQKGWENGNDWQYLKGYIETIKNNTYEFYRDMYKLYSGITNYNNSDQNDPIVKMGRMTFVLSMESFRVRNYSREKIDNSLEEVFNNAIITYIMNKNSFDNSIERRYKEVANIAAVVLVTFPHVAHYFE